MMSVTRLCRLPLGNAAGLRRLREHGRLSCCVAALFVGVCDLTAPPTLRADPSYQVEFGYRRVVAPERMAPVAVSLQGDNVDRTIDLRIRGEPAVSQRIELPQRTNKRIFVSVLPETTRTKGGVPILELFEGMRQLHEEQLIPVRSVDGRLMPVIGGPALRFSGATTVPIDGGFVPTRISAFEGVSAFVIYPSGWSELSGDAVAALKLWVGDGGVLVLPTISGSQRLLLPATHPFGPLSAAQAQVFRGLCRDLQEHINVPSRKRLRRQSKVQPWDIMTIAAAPSVSTAVYPKHADLPVLLAKASYGYGSIYFLTFDPQTLPRSKWPDADAALATIMRRVDPPSAPASTSRADSSVDTALLATRSSRVWFVLFLVVYLALITVGDYVLVRHFGKPRLTWLSFPLSVLLFTFLAVGMGQGRVGDAKYHELTWVDTLGGEWPGAPTAIAESVVGLYADSNQQFTFRPTSEGAVVRPWRRGEQGATYLYSQSEVVLNDKMSIFSDHFYRVLWRADSWLTRATWSREGRLGAVTIEGSLPSAPLYWVVGINDRLWWFAADGVERTSEGSWKCFLDSGATSAPSTSLWEGFPPTQVGEMVTRNTSLLYTKGADDDSAWVGVVMAEPFPVLSVDERSPEPQGAAIIRCAVRGAPGKRDTETELPVEDPVLDER